MHSRIFASLDFRFRGSINMTIMNIFFYFASLISFLIAVYEGCSIIIMRKKVLTVIGTVIDTKSAVSEAYKQSNSKFATMRYNINSRDYTSENRIQVPSWTKIGDEKQIKVFIDRPWIICTKSFIKFIVLLSLALLCALIGYLI